METLINTIKTVTVLGAAGAMGSNISAIFASFGVAKVYMLDIEKPEKTIDKAVKSVRAESIRSRLIPADYSMLEECIRESDLVFESAINFLLTFLLLTIMYLPSLNEGKPFGHLNEALPTNLFGSVVLNVASVNFET